MFAGITGSLSTVSYEQFFNASKHKVAEQDIATVSTLFGITLSSIPEDRVATRSGGPVLPSKDASEDKQMLPKVLQALKAELPSSGVVP